MTSPGMNFLWGVARNPIIAQEHNCCFKINGLRRFNAFSEGWETALTSDVVKHSGNARSSQKLVFTLPLQNPATIRACVSDDQTPCPRLSGCDKLTDPLFR